MKYLGALLILICSALYGYHCHGCELERSATAQRLLGAMYFVTGQIEHKYPTDVIIKRLSALYPDEFSRNDTYESICSGSLARGEEGKLCSEFFAHLGKSHSSTQLSELKYTTKKMQTYVDELAESCKKNARIKAVLPLFFASIAVIVLF